MATNATQADVTAGATTLAAEHRAMTAPLEFLVDCAQNSHNAACDVSTRIQRKTTNAALNVSAIGKRPAAAVAAATLEGAVNPPLVVPLRPAHHRAVPLFASNV